MDLRFRIRSILLLTLLVLGSNQLFGQQFYFKSNLTGRHRFTDVVSFHQEDFLLREDSVCSLEKFDFDEVEFAPNESTIVFDLSKLQMKEGDTLVLNFIQYQSRDTVYYSSGYLDGSNSRNKKSYIKRNKGATKIKNLPDSIEFSLNGARLFATKSVATIMGVESGSGRKNGKSWGYSKTIFSTRVTYRY